MTHKTIKFWWRIIPANFAAIVLNLVVIVTIPFGLWHGLDPYQFITSLIAANTIVWCVTFAWFTFRPIDLGLD